MGHGFPRNVAADGFLREADLGESTTPWVKMMYTPFLTLRVLETHEVIVSVSRVLSGQMSIDDFMKLPEVSTASYPPYDVSDIRC